jgi:hypothetical protein
MESLYRFANEVTESLTKFELVELYYMQFVVLIEMHTMFVTVLFAFLAAVYFVAKKITSSEAIAIAILYSILAWYFIFGVFNSFVLLRATRSAITGNEQEALSYLLPIVLLCSWGISVWYLFQARRRLVNGGGT